MSDNVIDFDRNLGVDDYGYPTFTFEIGGEDTPLRIHEVVAQALVPNPEVCPWVKHKNGNIKDYSIDNLEWAFEDDFGNQFDIDTCSTVFGNPYIILAANAVKEYVDHKENTMNLIEDIQDAALKMYGKPMGLLPKECSAIVQEYVSQAGSEKAVWKPIIMMNKKTGKPEYTHYMINRMGVIWDRDMRRFTRESVTCDGYSVACISFGDHDVYMRVDKLVASTFLENQMHEKYVKHLTGVKHLNHYRMLGWSMIPEE